MNFLALTILTELDDYLFQTIYENPISKLIKDGEATICGRECSLEEIINIETTTSRQASLKIEGNRLGEKKDETSESYDNKFSINAPPSFIYISFWSRSWLNMICRCSYLVLRLFYVSVMFYFYPWVSLFMSYLEPYRL